jgi:hypothetical protein
MSDKQFTTLRSGLDQLKQLDSRTRHRIQVAMDLVEEFNKKIVKLDPRFAVITSVGIRLPELVNNHISLDSQSGEFEVCRDMAVRHAEKLAPALFQAIKTVSRDYPEVGNLKHKPTTLRNVKKPGV